MIADELLAYVRARLGSTIAYAEPPRTLSGGFVNDVYGFELAGVADEWSGPLVLRVYPRDLDVLAVRRERCAQEVVSAQGVPAPRVVVCEETSDAIGAPFMVMERLPGRVQLSIDFPRVLLEIPKLVTMHHRHAEAMRMVHRLDAAPLLAAFDAAGIDRRAAGPEHWLDTSEAMIGAYDLDGLRPGLGWLRANRPEPGRMAICHGDFFGGNILEMDGRISGILDWNLVTVADPAFDLGGQMAVNEMSPIQAPLPVRAIAAGVGRGLARGLRSAYPASELDANLVHYYAVMRAFTELTYKLAALERIRRTGVEERMPTWQPPQCVRYIKRRTGVSLSI